MTAPNAGGWYPVDTNHTHSHATSSSSSHHTHTHNHHSYTPLPLPLPQHPYAHPTAPQQQQWPTAYTTFDIPAPQSSPRWPPSTPTSTSASTSTTSAAAGASADLLLVSLAESYLEAAHAGGYRAAAAGSVGGEDREKEYYALVATGLRCFEAALGGGGRLQPRMEALVRLRYAGVLHEETENGDEAEGALNKGVSLYLSVLYLGWGGMRG